MPVHSVSDYLNSLIHDLDQSYEEYGKALRQSKKNLKNWNNLSLYHFQRMEKEHMDRIRCREKTLSAWLNDQSDMRTRMASQLSLLDSRREELLKENSSLIEEIRSVMYTLKKEQNSLRIPRSKTRIKESVPKLIDIKL